MFPGKTATKNRATIQPTAARWFCIIIKETPKIISTTPDKITTNSGFIGTQLGTCAKKAVRIKVRCPVPVKIKNSPSSVLTILCAFVDCIIVQLNYSAAIPPSITCVVPVMYLLSSLARNKTSLAISMGSA